MDDDSSRKDSPSTGGNQVKAQVNKSDRNDARGIAQMMRVGLFQPVHVKTLASQKRRALLAARKILQEQALAIENDIRGLLRISLRRLPAEENPIPALNEIRAEKAIENAMLGNDASSLHLLGAVWENALYRQ